MAKTNGQDVDLFESAGVSPPSVSPAELRKRAASMADFHFDSWWDRYPNDGTSPRGSEDSARKAYAKVLAGSLGVTAGILTERLSFYIDARARYYEIWGRPAPLLRATTFLNGRHRDYSSAWSDTDLRFWPPPDGDRRRWDDVLAARHNGGMSHADRVAEAEAKWQAEHG